jgi:hypothetical protein
MAQEKTNHDEYVFLDTDTLVTERIDLDLQERETAVKPVDIGDQFWGRRESLEHWKLVCDNPRFGDYFSTADEKPVPSYFNSGVVVTRDPKLGSKWLGKVEEMSNRNWESERFKDQVSLGAVLSEQKVNTLSEVYNFPLNSRWTAPSNTKIIHYHEVENLWKTALTPSLFRKVWKTGMLQSYSGYQTPYRIARKMLHTYQFSKYRS